MVKGKRNKSLAEKRHAKRMTMKASGGQSPYAKKRVYLDSRGPEREWGFNYPNKPWR